MEQSTTQSTRTLVTDITNTYKLKGNTFTRKQRVSSFISKHPVGHYIIMTKKGEGTVVNGQLMSPISMKALVEVAYTND